MMKKNPIVNAVLASAYITLIASGIFYGPKVEHINPSVLQPIAFLSLLTLSVAVMGYLFVFTPLMMYIDGDKKRAVTFFLQTVGAFAILTILAFVLILVI